jgi:hypothetical protein
MNDKTTTESALWVAVLADHSGFVYESVEDARENAEDPEGEEFEISVRRGSAAVITPAGDRGRLPGSYLSGDLAYELDDVWLDDDDETVGVAVRFAQAQAMAAGLNTAQGAQAVNA